MWTENASFENHFKLDENSLKSRSSHTLSQPCCTALLSVDRFRRFPLEFSPWPSSISFPSGHFTREEAADQAMAHDSATVLGSLPSLAIGQRTPQEISLLTKSCSPNPRPPCTRTSKTFFAVSALRRAPLRPDTHHPHLIP